eukprot:CAMPEP_0182420968 /NCGR_PEP_ID=MMETSP1167-20130531/6103_1 /TAXON_ID=2988 /ORGANISM="Mallomonas Sp, Strain CCMP3275" /LENGTH=735 /DNA_ID=CAMNT_0024597589 /DNA_START=41 /DNA_END=2248 /DNA_ORIENTATION=+
MTDHERRRYIVVGCGAAATVLCERLSKKANVILLERGDPCLQNTESSPIEWASSAYSGDGAIRYQTIPQTRLYNRKIIYPQGVGLGGSALVNATMWTGGHSSVFDKYWPKEWNAGAMEKLMISSSEVFHATEFITCGKMRDLLLATGSSDLPGGETDDMTTNLYPSLSTNRNTSAVTSTSKSFWSNSVQWKHFSCTSLQTDEDREGRRYERLDIKKLLDNCPSVQVMSGVEALSVSFDYNDAGGEGEGHHSIATATGVVIRDQEGRVWTVRPSGGGEIILCAGVFETPRLLFSSGFSSHPPPTACISEGKHQAERTHANCKRQYLPDLGRGLQDHVLLPVMMLGDWWETHGGTDARGICLWDRLWIPEILKNVFRPLSQSRSTVVRILACLLRVFLLALFGSTASISSLDSESQSSSLTSPSQSQSHSGSTDRDLNIDPSPPHVFSHLPEQFQSAAGKGCGDGVHGWLMLNEQGEVLPTDSSEIPSIQLVLVDGRMLPGMLAQLALPNVVWDTRVRWKRVVSVFLTTLRSTLEFIIQMLTKLEVVRALLGCFFGFLVCVVQPKSRGELFVGSHGLREPLSIDPAYLSDEAETDYQLLITGVTAVRNLFAQLRAHRNNNSDHQADAQDCDNLHCVELLPGYLPLSLYTRLYAAPYFHSCGTCAMVSYDAASERGVVTPDLRVKNTKGLRIADASVIPMIPSGPIICTCAAIGQAAAELLMMDATTTSIGWCDVESD